MATNPMQRKARNSFLLGVLATVVVAGLIIAFLVVQLKNYKDKEQEELANSTRVWVLSEDVISGQVITTDMLTQQVVNKNLVPSNAIGDMSILDNYALEDKEGNEVTTEYRNNEATLYLTRNNTRYELLQEEETDSYYIEVNGDKEYVELTQTPIVAKVDMNSNTVITIDMIAKSDEVTTNDLRKQEYNMIVLPSQLTTGEYVDVRLSMPNGADYIVVSKKQVEIPQVNGVDVEDTVWLNMTEEEILTMNNAIVDAYRALGSKLYLSTYTEAGTQDAATPTYVPSETVVRLVQSDPNIVQTAKNALIARYNENAQSVRNESINQSINNSGTEGEDNLRTQVDESITNSRESIQEYLESLGATPTAE